MQRPTGSSLGVLALSPSAASMELAALCVVLASLKVSPNRSQFFQRESLSLSCESAGDSSAWTIHKDLSGLQSCSSSCSFELLYKMDSGSYRCQSRDGHCSNVVNVTVTEGAVILESPTVPVTEGQAVTLWCRHRGASSNLTAHFYRDDRLIGSSSTGNLSLLAVSRADGGLYGCRVPGLGESPVSRLEVRGRPEPPPPSVPVLALVLLPVVGVGLLLLLVWLLLCLWRSCKGEVEQAVSYVDVTIAQTAAPRRLTDLDGGHVFYSTLNLDTL